MITISDDFTTRCWREDAAKARKLRNPEEGKAARWGCGWADPYGAAGNEWKAHDGWKAEFDEDDSI